MTTNTPLPDHAWSTLVDMDERHAQKTLEGFRKSVESRGCVYAVRELSDQAVHADLTLRFVRHFADGRDNYDMTPREAVKHALTALDCSPKRSSARFLGSNSSDRFHAAVHHEEFLARTRLWDRYEAATWE